MIRKIVWIVAGVIWGNLVFLIGLHIFFPSKVVLDRIKYEVSSRSSQAWALSASHASFWHLTGIRLDDVKLLRSKKTPRVAAARRSARRPEDEMGDPTDPDMLDDDASSGNTAAEAEAAYSAQTLGVRLRVLPLLLARISAGFDVGMYDGDITGSYTKASSGQKVSLDISDIDLNLLPKDGEALAFDLAGTLQGEVELDLSESDPTRSTGKGQLSIDGLELKSAKISGIAINQQAKFDTADIEFEVADGKAKITKGEFDADILKATIEGDVALSKKFVRSRLHVPVVFSVNSDLDSMIGLVPGAREAKDDEGNWHFLLSGTIEHPRFRPDKVKKTMMAAGAAPRNPGLRPQQGDVPRPGATLGQEGEGDPGRMTADERRKLREERMRERRERLRARRENGMDEEPMPDDQRMGRRMPQDFEGKYPPGQVRPPDYIPPEDMEPQGQLPPPDEPDQRQMMPDEEPPPPEEE
jgi:type II secretion system protein N